MNLPKSVKIVEVGPRDGLQSEKTVLDVQSKVHFVNQLSLTGLRSIEVGSFVSEKWVPQMANSGKVFQQIECHANVTYTALTPNLKGLEQAIECGVSEIAIFASASQSFSHKNINCSIEQSLQRFGQVTKLALQAGLKVRGYLSCVAGCPYEGEVSADSIVQVTHSLLELGCYEVSLGDTIGVGTPRQIENMLARLSKTVSLSQLAVHMHDTYGQALTNILVALQMGVSVVDASVAGLGGCPYAKGASGNVATEELVYMLNGLGIEHGVDLKKLIAVGKDISQKLNRTNASKVATAMVQL